MKENLEHLLKEQKLKHSKHDELIISVEKDLLLTDSVLPMFKSAYFKMKTPKRDWEGDIDLLMMHYFAKDYPYVYHWQEVPQEDSKLLLFEMKTFDSSRNYHKAISQLKKEKSFIKTFTNYQNIDCFYSFYVGNGKTWRYEKEL